MFIGHWKRLGAHGSINSSDDHNSKSWSIPVLTYKTGKADVGAFTTNYSITIACNIEIHFCYCKIILSSNIY